MDGISFKKLKWEATKHLQEAIWFYEWVYDTQHVLHNEIEIVFCLQICMWS